LFRRRPEQLSLVSGHDGGIRKDAMYCSDGKCNALVRAI
jgi:hypothetical protein